LASPWSVDGGRGMGKGSRGERGDAEGGRGGVSLQKAEEGKAGNGVAQTIAFPNGVWERGANEEPSLG